MTDDEARLRRAKQAGRNAVRSGLDVFHARLTRPLPSSATRGPPRPRPPGSAPDWFGGCTLSRPSKK
jgi:hypothetical protein